MSETCSEDEAFELDLQIVSSDPSNLPSISTTRQPRPGQTFTNPFSGGGGGRGGGRKKPRDDSYEVPSNNQDDFELTSWGRRKLKEAENDKKLRSKRVTQLIVNSQKHHNAMQKRAQQNIQLIEDRRTATLKEHWCCRQLVAEGDKQGGLGWLSKIQTSSYTVKVVGLCFCEPLDVHCYRCDQCGLSVDVSPCDLGCHPSSAVQPRVYYDIQMFEFFRHLNQLGGLSIHGAF